jgi:hypothetical protein
MFTDASKKSTAVRVEGKPSKHQSENPDDGDSAFLKASPFVFQTTWRNTTDDSKLTPYFLLIKFIPISYFPLVLHFISPPFTSHFFLLSNFSIFPSSSHTFRYMCVLLLFLSFNSFLVYPFLTPPWYDVLFCIFLVKDEIQCRGLANPVTNLRVGPRHSSGGRLVAGFPPRRPGFKPGSGHVGFCDGQNWRWGRLSPRTSVSLANIHSICFSTIIFTITRGWHNRPGAAAVPIASQTK